MYAVIVFWVIGFLSTPVPSDFLKVNTILDLKSDAYEILKSKCNGCHQVKNPARVFTLDNMDKFSAVIYKQVFVKKRMPKGKEIKLTDDEYERLRKWLMQHE